MDVYLTLDYELFLGASSGCVKRCLLDTMEKLATIAERNGARFTIFTDTTWLCRMRELAHTHSELAADYTAVAQSLAGLSAAGHDIQLHIHPQWAFSDYSDGGWKLDQKHYKLSDVGEDLADRMFADGCNIIEEITGRRPSAFRAGGFSAQPTDLLTRLMKKHGIVADSSVCPGQCYHSAQQDYDYTTAPHGRAYRFGSDINVAEPQGAFVELPLSIVDVSPLYYWRLVFQRLTRQKCHRRLGDGISVKTTGSSIRYRLTHTSTGFATIDESKISFLGRAYKEARKRGDSEFCVIGHPKLATEYSLKRLDRELALMAADGATFKTISMLAQ